MWALLLPLGALYAAAGATAPPAPPAARAFPVEPVDGAVVGPRPVFVAGYETDDEAADPRPLRFRLSLVPAGRGGRAYTFDQREDRGGWLWGGDDRVLYRPGVPLVDGTYRWQVAVWNGMDWIAGSSVHALRVDGTPPAEVESLEVRTDPVSGQVILDWPPVTLDRDGRPEYVARYHLYRYESSPFPPLLRAHEIGSTPEPHFVDEAPAAAQILFYRVTAEDEAGNELGRPD